MRKYVCFLILPLGILLQSQTTTPALTGKSKTDLSAPGLNTQSQTSEISPCEIQALSEAPTAFDKSRFTHMAAFSGNGSFTIPAGVTEVLIEMWGAGGGGHLPGGGGGSGGYWTGLIPVTGISSISISVGNGGTPGSFATAAGNGGNTSFSCTGFNVITGGGGGADSTTFAGSDSYAGGQGGAAVVTAALPIGFNAFYTMNGQAGSPTLIDYVQINATTFCRRFTVGQGGIAPFSGQMPNFVTSFTKAAGSGFKAVSSTFVTSVIPPFGAGGSPAALNVATSGGKGRVAIYF